MISPFFFHFILAVAWIYLSGMVQFDRTKSIFSQPESITISTMQSNPGCQPERFRSHQSGGPFPMNLDEFECKCQLGLERIR